MKYYMTMIVFALMALFSQFDPVIAQPSFKEVVKPTTPEDDSKSNSDSVPEVISIAGEIKRILILRFKYQADLLQGLEKSVSENGIQNAVILSGIGSVRNYHIHSVSNNEFPSKNIYIKDTDSPADITSINGYIINGRVHAHVTLADEKGAFGGHLELGTTVFTFAVVTIGVLQEGIDISRVDDKTFR